MWLRLKPKLIELGIKVVLPFVLERLVRSGKLSEAQAVAIEFGVDVQQFIASMKTYPEYPGDPKPPTSVSNINGGSQS